ncbi:MAG TPA: signal peptidase I [Thermoleophilaceae bacterium]|jgi:signal peptidase I
MIVTAGAATLALGGCGSQVRAVEKSMEPTIRSGEYVSLDEDAYRSADPAVGDIVSFRAPAGADEACGDGGEPPPSDRPCPRATDRLGDESFIKRVVAGPGDRVAIRDGGHAVVDGVELAEPYAQLCAPADGCDYPRSIRVPRGHWFVLGDNRPYALDSRHFGPIPRRALEGRVTPPG